MQSQFAVEQAQDAVDVAHAVFESQGSFILLSMSKFQYYKIRLNTL